jgi:hypothetical protein
MRFQPRTASSGWKKPVMLWIWFSRRRGDFRNHSSLNARIDSGFNSPLGSHGGALMRTRGAYSRAPACFGAGSSSSCAWLPRVSTERPRCLPPVTQSIHATE